MLYSIIQRQRKIYRRKKIKNSDRSQNERYKRQKEFLSIDTKRECVPSPSNKCINIMFIE